jgi:sphingolipid delta-4 desaturase
LFGSDASSGVWVVGLVAAHVALSVLSARMPAWLLLLLASTLGAGIAHALGVLIHEASHNLIFKRTPWNKACSILANVPLGAPAALDFRHQHLLHHRHLGDTAEPNGRDTQAPTRREVTVVGHSSLWKLLSFTFGRFFYEGRAANRAPHDRWWLANAVACVAADGLIFWAGGLHALLYVVVSSLLAFGPHVFGARRVSEHLTMRRGQPTNSYYGVLNYLAFDVGYHVEHHDFPSVPWRRLRALNAIARRHYDGLAFIRSWSRLMAHYFFDERFSVAQYTGMSDEYLDEIVGRPPTSAPSPR